MRKLFTMTLAAVLSAFLLATAFHSGKRAGFRTGSEWAILQAAIVAREAGIALPLYLHDGAIRVVLRQPPGLYQKAWRLADRFEETNRTNQTEKGEVARGGVANF